MMKVCAITNVYNEDFNLRHWLRHYGKEVGEENCIVLDHGSTDGSTADIGKAGRINIPRTKFSDEQRARLISGIASSMLHTYDAVIYSDCDEMLVADPTLFTGLVDFCGALEAPCATAIGLNVVHNLVDEVSIHRNAPLLRQRRFVQFVSPMCKSLIIREPVTWGIGFHGCSLPPAFSHLYLFHLRWMDIGECLRRLTTTQQISFDNNPAGHHHHKSFQDYLQTFQSFSRREISDSFEFEEYIEKLCGTIRKTGEGIYQFNVDMRSDKAFKIPDRFADSF